MPYSAAYYTEEHTKLLGELTVEKYHELAAKYTTDAVLKTVDVESETLDQELGDALKTTQMVLVSGAMHTTADGVMEMKEKFEKLVHCIRRVVPEGRHYIHILGPHKTPYPHPKLLKMLEDKVYTLDGGFWAPGEPMPEETIMAERNGDAIRLTTFMMCSILSNFNVIRTKGITPRTLGCDPARVPKEMMDAEALSAEHVIQFVKAVAAVAFPEMYMDINADDTAVIKAMEGVQKLKTPSAEPPSPKRKLLSDKSETIGLHCNEVYEMLLKAEAFDVQKKLGQLPILTSKWFDVVKGTPTEKFSNFDADDLQKLGANSLVQAFVIMLRVHAGDDTLYDRLVFDIETGNVPVESAMHGPVKNPDKASELKYLFSGCYPDRFWGKTAGSPRYTVKPDGLVHTDGKPQVGHLGNGAELVRMAMTGDQGALDFVKLDAPLKKEDMGAGAARVLEKFWGVVGM
jgi:hypothetical protein